MSKVELKSVEERVAPTPTPEELKALIQADKQARTARAGQRIQAILDEERCQIVPMMILTNGSVTAKLDIQALD